ncbi:hypothetical protein GIY30_02180 [Gordonia sp. HNM0687]|uniref:DUF4062 domain-containing protein n=2 Tax=Gordonia mangrovi TaxID=2665643 RepID=A0A6L7GNR2_9ACTN|nr:DUF4062 domain-containing protein [Gordonia mangrovi]MXP20178.1 hypothetical protein [Gordonia mangrovi]UVF79215.1 hypothetical protein NWF22_05060 [Gordonia mangrovi]
MDHERDVINSLVIPNVNRLLRAKGRSAALYALDFRWGIETDESTDQRLRERVILQRCVDELRRCLPLFVGLIGDSYGYLPNQVDAREILARAGVQAPGFPLSVTALEMMAAAANASSLERLSPIFLSRHCEVPGGHARAADKPQISELRRHLHDAGCTVHRYHAFSEAGQQDFGETFTEYLQHALLALARQVLGEVAEKQSWIAEEVGLHRGRMEEEADNFRGRADVLEALEDHRGRPDPFGRAWRLGDEVNEFSRLRMRFADSMVAVLADPGAGKSALLAKIACDGNLSTVPHRAIHDRSDRAYCRVGITPRSTRLAVCLLVLLAQLDPDLAERVASQHDPDGLRLGDVLPSWIECLGPPRLGSEPTIIVDGLDKMASTDSESYSLAWMSTEMVQGAYFVVSANNGSPAAHIVRTRPLTTVFELNPLSPEDARLMVSGAIARHHRSLPELLIRRLAHKSANARWLSIATQLLLTLSRHDYHSLRNEDSSADPQVRLRAMLSRTIEQLPADLEDLSSDYLFRLLEFADPSVTPALILLTVSSSGVREFDVLSIFGEGSKFRRDESGYGVSAITPTMLSVTQDLFDGLIDVRDSGRMAFVSDSTEQAWRGILADSILEVGGDPEAVVLDYRRTFIAHLLTLPLDDPLRIDELLLQLWIADDIPFLAHALHDPQLSAVSSVALFGAVFAVATSDAAAVRSVLELPLPPDEKLTLTSFLVSAVTRMDLAQASQAAVEIKEALEQMPASAASRTGASAADVLAQLSTLPGASGIGGVFGHWEPFIRALVDGHAQLSQGPYLDPVNDFERRMFIEVQLTMVTQFALTVFDRTDPTFEDFQQIGFRLESARDHLEQLPPDDDAGEYLRILESVANRAVMLLGITATLPPLEDDLSRAEQAFDTTGGAAIYGVLMALCARVRTEVAVGLQVAEGGNPSPGDLVRALSEIDRARWRLEVGLALNPTMRIVRAELMALLTERLSLLDTAEQAGSSAESALRLAELAIDDDKVDPSDFIGIAARAVFGWAFSRLDGSVTTIVERMLELLDGDHLGTVIDDDSRAVAEVALLTAAVDVGAADGEYELSLALGRRAVALQQAGYEFADGEATAYEILRERLENVREELIGILEEADSLAGLTAEIDIGDIMSHCRWADELFTMCSGRSDTQVEDHLGRMLAQTLAGAVSGDPTVLANARLIYQSLEDLEGLDDEHQRILDVTACHLQS